MKTTNLYCVIMAGGAGTRFWPVSRKAQPKQFIDLLSTGRTLLQSTYDRLVNLCPAEHIFVVTEHSYQPLVHEQVPEIPLNQVLLEPTRRNTAPCIAYAIQCIKKKDPEALVLVCPSDHIIMKEREFCHEVEQALPFVQNNDVLLTFGIAPTRPDTGYGYIEADSEGVTSGGQEKVKRFTEKPNLETAIKFIESNNFYWNAGIFLWSVESIERAFSKYLPQIHSLFELGKASYGTDSEPQFIQETYETCESISIDYGVMEKADNVYVRAVDIAWSDLGTWGALYQQLSHDDEQNVVQGEHIMLYDVKNSIVNSSDQLVVAEGLDGYIIANTPQSLLICRKENEQKIRDYVANLNTPERENYQ